MTRDVNDARHYKAQAETKAKWFKTKAEFET